MAVQPCIVALLPFPEYATDMVNVLIDQFHYAAGRG